jgi:hypothetical protein
VALTDTSARTAQVRSQLFRELSPAQKSAMVEEMSEDARELARIGIRRRHPDYNVAEVEHALHRLLLGDALADRAWPEHTHLRP